jgi:hypothetical protein
LIAEQHEITTGMFRGHGMSMKSSYILAKVFFFTLEISDHPNRLSELSE